MRRVNAGEQGMRETKDAGGPQTLMLTFMAGFALFFLSYGFSLIRTAPS
jgi:hypothetical protein